MDGITLFLLAAIYLLPAGVAHTRKHKNSGAIIGLNILLGWTVLGWIGAFVWALTGNVDASRRTSEAQIRCPECQEYVLAAARKCKHCGAALTPG